MAAPFRGGRSQSRKRQLPQAGSPLRCPPYGKTESLRHATEKGFAVGPILYLLLMAGVAAGVLFSGYSQILRANLNVTNATMAKGDLNGSSTTLAATGQMSTDEQTFCPPRGPGASAGCTGVPEKLVPFAGAENAKLPTDYANVSSSGSPLEWGVFAAGAGVKQLDPWGRYYIYCRWENPRASADQPALVIISAGANGKLETRCGDATPSGDDQMSRQSVGEAINRASVWQQESSGEASYGENLKVTASGVIEAKGLILTDSATVNALNLTTPLPVISGGTGASTAPNARSNLGSGVIGDALFIATTASGARSTLGATDVGHYLFSGTSLVEETASAARLNLLGAGTVGNDVFIADTATAGRSALGATPMGSYLFSSSTFDSTLGPQVRAALLGSSSIGDTVFTAGTYDIALTALGGTDTGKAVFQADSKPTARTVLGAGAEGSLLFTATSQLHAWEILGLTGSLNPYLDISVSGSAATVDAGGITGGAVPIVHGGTSATTASSALDNLFAGDTTPSIAMSTSRIAANSITSAKLNNIVSAGTYNLVEVDSAGRVISGSYSPISSNEITDGNGNTVQVTSTGGGYIYFSTNNNVGMTLDPNGYLGLATSTPQERLHVNNGNVRISNSAGTSRELQFTTGTTAKRWVVATDGTSESGGSTGSNFVINRVTDGGVAANALTINRATGNATFAGQVAATGGFLGVFTGTFSGQFSGGMVLGDTATQTSPHRNGDETTGLFSDAASTVEISTGGVERLRVTGTGSVGIGTSAPNYPLDVSGTAAAHLVHFTGTTTGAGELSGTATGTPGAIQYNDGNNNLAGDSYLTWKPGSISLGIGTATPRAAVDVGYLTGAMIVPVGTSAQRPSAPALGMIRYNPTTGTFEGYQGTSPGWSSIGSGASGSYFGGTAAATNPSRSDDATTGLFSDTSSSISFATAGVERMRLTGAGFLGLGTATPSVTLDMRTKTDAVSIPNGSSAQRPSSAVSGMMRYNSDLGVFEGYTASGWGSLAAGTGISAASAGQSLVSGWPDAIVCTTTYSSINVGIWYLVAAPQSNGKYWYRMPASTDLAIEFNADGSFYAYQTITSSNCATSISALVANGQAFNFVNSSTSNAIAMDDGTAAAPGLYFGADTNTGLYRPAADTVGVATGGVEQMRVTASGYVGIGTTTPNAGLDVGKGSIRVMANNTPLSGSGLELYYIGASNEAYALAIDRTTPAYKSFDIEGSQLRFGTMGSERLRITSTGSIGIGTTVPAVSLDLSTKTDAVSLPSGATTARPATGAVGMMRYNTTLGAFEGYTASGWGSLGSGSTTGVTTAGQSMFSGWPDAIVCKYGAGRSGVFILEWYDVSAVSYSMKSWGTEAGSSTTNWYVRFDPTGAYSSFNIASGFTLDCATNAWSISQLIANGRAFNLANSSTSNAIAMDDGTAAAPGLYFGADTNTGLYRPAADTVGVATGGVEQMRVTASGYVGIGTTTPAGILQVSSAAAPWLNVQTLSNTNVPMVGLLNAAGTMVGTLTAYTGGSNTLELGNYQNGPLTFKTNGTEFMRITAAGNVGIGTASPTAGALLDLSAGNTASNSSLLLPQGTTTNRPATGAVGMMRYNTTLGAFEGYTASGWGSLGSGSGSGTGTSGQSMLSGWPDVIMCYTSYYSANIPFYVDSRDQSNSVVIYRALINSASDAYVSYNITTGAYSAGVAGWLSTIDCMTSAYSISTLVTNGKAFNLVNSSTSNAIAMDDGTSAAPGLYFGADTNTGLYRPAADTVGVATGGVERLRVDANGAVGIKTTSVTSGAVLDLASATGTAYSSLILPKDTTANRPTTGVAGMMRYNTTLGAFEGYTASGWGSLGSGSTTGVTTAGQSMFSGWPDAIICYVNTSIPVVFYSIWDSTSQVGYAANTNSYGTTRVFFSPTTGAYSGGDNTISAWTSIDCQSNGWTIAQYVTNGRAFNFVNSSTSNAIAMDDGTAAAPGLYFGADTNTGLYRPAADTVGVATGGVERMRLTASGYVGIGGTTASTVLNVYGPFGFPSSTGSTATDTAFRISNTTAGASGGALDVGQAGDSGSWIQSRLASDYTTNFSLLLNPNGGRVGIGTTTPIVGALLDLSAGTATSNSSLLLPKGTTTTRPTTGVAGMMRYNTTLGAFEGYTASGWGSLGSGTSGSGSGTGLVSGWPDGFVCTATSPWAGPTIFWARTLGGTGGIDYEVIQASSSVFYDMTFASTTAASSSNVTSDCSGKTVSQLIASGNAFYVGGGSSSSSILGTTATGTSPHISGDVTTGLFSDTASNVSIATSGTERLRLDGSGRVGVGASLLSVSNASTIDPRLLVVGSGVANGIQSVRTGTPGSGGAQIVLSSTRGALPTTYTALQSGDGIGTLSFNGADGSQFDAGALILAQVDGTVSTGVLPTRLIFNTNRGAGANATTEAMRIDSAGRIGMSGNNTMAINAGGVLDLSSATGTAYSSLILPKDTSANRPTTGVAGMMRYNTTLGAFEGYTASGWGSLGGSTTGVTTAGQSLISGWPDVIMCTIVSGGQSYLTAYYQDLQSSGANVSIYRSILNTNFDAYIGFYLTGSYETGVVGSTWTSNDCITNTYSISQLVSMGRAYNTVNSSTSNAIAMDDGTAAAPGLYFGADTNTGLYRPAADTVGVATGGVERMRVDANGAVGIKTTAVTSGAVLDLASATGTAYSSLILPKDTTANRPTTGVAGMMRYNTTLGAFEGYTASGWGSLGSGSTTGVTTAGQSMVSGWPDIVMCSVVSSGTTYAMPYYLTSSSASATYYRTTINTAGDSYLGYTAAGVYSAGALGPWTSVDCITNATSIASLVSSGKAFNFVNSSTSNAIAMDDGTAAAPGLYFGADTNTGLYRPAADTVGIATGGVERLRVTASGFVGLGTTSPSNPLTITSSSATASQVMISNGTYSGNAAVGVGQNGLWIGGAAYLSGGSWAANNTAGTMVGVMADGFHVGYFSGATIGSTVSLSYALNVTTTGSVGIGTASPTAGALLDLSAGTATSNSSLLLPKGTTTTRPTTGAAGMMRYNTTLGAFEGYTASGWGSLGSGSTTSVTTAGQSLLSGWPDVIMCNIVSNGVTYYMAYMLFDQSTTLTTYRAIVNNGGDSSVSYNTTNGAYSSAVVYYSSNDCVSNAYTIAQLVTNGRAFNFVNSSTSNAIAMDDGTAAAPGLYFGADTNTGLYRPAADTVGIATGGVERLRIAASGNVGIGTTTPSAPLDVRNRLIIANSDYVSSSAGSGLQIYQTATSGDTNSQIQAFKAGYTAGSNLILQPWQGTVAIGTSSPTAGALLDLSAGTATTNSSLLLPKGTTVTRPTTGVVGMMRYNTTSGAFEGYTGSGWGSFASSSSGYLGTAATTAAPARSDDVTTGLFSATASTVSITTSGTERLRVTGTGSVGIGTTTPAMPLDVSLGNGNVALGGGTAVAASVAGYGLTIRGSTSNYNLEVNDGGGRVNQLWNASGSTGTYLISSEPASRLLQTVSSTTGALFGFYSAPSGTAGNTITWTQIAELNGASDIWFSPRGTSSDLYMTASGSVGIGTTTPIDKFYVAGALHSTNNAAAHGASEAFLDYIPGVAGRIAVVGADAATKGAFRIDQYSSDNSLGSVALMITASGNVGIGTTSPASAFDVTGKITSRYDGTILSNQWTDSLGTFHLNAWNNVELDTGSNARLFVQGTTGTISIGSTAPIAGALLDLSAGTTTTNSSLLLPQGTTTNRPTTGVIGMMRYNTTTGAFEGYASGGWGSFASSSSSTLGTATTANNPSRSGEATTGLFSPATGSVAITSLGTEALRVTASGYVGIGNTAPAAKLDVTGDINTTGNLALGGAGLVSYRGLNMAQTIADASKVGIYNSQTISGTQTAARVNYGVYSLMTNSAVNGSYSNGLQGVYSDIINATGGGNATEAGLYGRITNNDASATTGNMTGVGGLVNNAVAGTIYSAYGGYGGVTNSSTGTITSGMGNYGQVQNSSSGTISAARGLYGTVANASSGTISNARGLEGVITNSSGSMPSSYGVFSSTNQLTSGGTIGTNYSYYAQAIQSAGTFSTNYLFYGTYSGTIGTKWGVYLSGETSNYLSGTLGIKTAAVNAGSVLDLSGATGTAYSSLLLPGDTTANRPTTGVVGMMRYNTTLGAFEGYTASGWGSLGGSTTGITTAGQSMVSGWPDAILCTVTAPYTGTLVLYPQWEPIASSGLYQYQNIVSGNQYQVAFNTDGTFNSYRGITASNCYASISTLVSNGQAVNFVNSSTSNAIAMDNGTAAAPGLYFGADTNTGLYRPAADTVGIATGGVERLRIDANGAVGIKTTSVTSGAVLDLASATGTAYSSLLLPGDTTANRPTTGVVGMMRYNTTLGAFEGYTASGWGSLGGSTTGITTAGQSFVSGWPDAIVCTVTGPGTWGSVPFYLTHAPNADGTYIYRMLWFNGSTSYGIIFSSTGAYASAENSLVTDCNSKSISQLVTSGKAVNLVNSSTSNAIAMDDGTAAAPGLYFGADTNTGLYRPAADTVGIATGGVERMRVTASGFVGIGVTAPSYPLQVGSDSTNGNGAFLSTAGAWTNVSDRRVKEDIRPITYSLDDVMKLKPVSYEMKGSHEKQIGFIAQDVEPVVPEVVSISKEGRYGLNYGNMVALSVKAIQELKAENDTLAQKIEKLKPDEREAKDQSLVYLLLGTLALMIALSVSLWLASRRRISVLEQEIRAVRLLLSEKGRGTT